MVLFAASYTVTKVALVDIGPFTLGAVRFLLATVLIAAWIGIRGGWERPPQRTPSVWRWADCSG